MYRKKKNLGQNNEDPDSGQVILVSRRKRIIHITGYVCEKMTSDFLLQLLDLRSDEEHGSDPILVIVNSAGGDLNDGFAMVNLINAFKIEIHVVVMGLCCSAATLFTSVCHRRYTFPNSFFLIHEIKPDDAAIKFNEVIEGARILQQMMSQILTIYVKATGKSIQEIQHDVTESKWLTAEEALEYGPRGLVDEIITEFPEMFS